MSIKDTKKPRAASATEDPAIEPSWLGSEFLGKLTKLEVPPHKAPKRIHVGLAMRVTGQLWKHLPPWVEASINQMAGDQAINSAKLEQPRCRIGFVFKGMGDEKREMTIEACTLKPGLTIKFTMPPDADACEVELCVNLILPYKPDRVKFLGDHMDTVMKFRGFTAKTEQEPLPLDGKSKAAGEGVAMTTTGVKVPESELAQVEKKGRRGKKAA